MKGSVVDLSDCFLLLYKIIRQPNCCDLDCFIQIFVIIHFLLAESDLGKKVLWFTAGSIHELTFHSS